MVQFNPQSTADYTSQQPYGPTAAQAAAADKAAGVSGIKYPETAGTIPSTENPTVIVPITQNNDPIGLKTGQEAFQAAVDSGKKAPQDAGEARTAIQEFKPQPEQSLFYKPDPNNATLVNAQGIPVSYDQYIAQGGLPDFSNVKTGQPPIQVGVGEGTVTPDGQAPVVTTGEKPANIISSAINQQLAEDPGYQQLLATYAEYNDIQNQSQSMVDTYKQLSSDLGIPTMNEQLVNWKSIIDGTEDDIRKEVEAVNGFATESQILALTSARNEQVIKNYNNLLNTKALAQETLTTMVGLAAQDRMFAMDAINQKLLINEQINNYRDRFVQNAREGYNTVINALGYQGLTESLQNDSNALALAEQTLGLSSGSLQSLALQESRTENLRLIEGMNITTPYFFSGGIGYDTRTGKVYHSAQELFADAGVSSWDEFNKRGLGTDVTKEIEQQKAIQQQSDLLDLQLKQSQLATDAAQRANIYDTIASRGVPDVEETKKAEQKQRNAIDQANIVIGKVDEALGQVNSLTTGFFGGYSQNIKGTAAYNLNATINTIKSNVGFKALQALRDASPTGGALGQVSEMENILLQSTIASLEIGQDEKQLKQNLNEVKIHFENVKLIIEADQNNWQVEYSPDGKDLILITD